MARRIGALQRNIQNLSRAINKIDPSLVNKTEGVQYQISDVKMGINDFSYKKDGKMVKVRYDQITNLSNFEQASLLNKLSAERYELRQKKAFEDYGKKGKISKSFIRTILKDNPELANSIEELEQNIEEEFKAIERKKITNEFNKVNFSNDYLDEANDYFNDINGSELLNDFYDVWGTKVGFTKMNAFTWNAYKVMKGLVI